MTGTYQPSRGQRESAMFQLASAVSTTYSEGMVDDLLEFARVVRDQLTNDYDRWFFTVALDLCPVHVIDAEICENNDDPTCALERQGFTGEGAK